MSKPLPNILITGTPGVGKTTLSSTLAESLPGFTHYETSELVKSHNLYTSYDPDMQTHIVDDDLLIDHFDSIIAPGACIVDGHDPGVFPERYFQLVIVLRCRTETLYDRLQGEPHREPQPLISAA